MAVIQSTEEPGMLLSMDTLIVSEWTWFSNRITTKCNSRYVRCWVVPLDIQARLEEVTFFWIHVTIELNIRKAWALIPVSQLSHPGEVSTLSSFLIICKFLCPPFQMERDRGLELDSSQVSQFSLLSGFWPLSGVTGSELPGPQVTTSALHWEFPPFSKELEARERGSCLPEVSWRMTDRTSFHCYI